MKKLDTRQKILIDGYWLDDKEKFNGYLCLVNDMSSQEDDEYFYYFSSWNDLESFRTPGTEEFVITKVYEE
jgi:hypothetical protein